MRMIRTNAVSFIQCSNLQCFWDFSKNRMLMNFQTIGKTGKFSVQEMDKPSKILKEYPLYLWLQGREDKLRLSM